MSSMGWWNWPGWPTASEWSAWWAFLALGPALVAGLAAVLAVSIARRQLGELIRSNDALREANDAASRSNLAVSRPYVTVAVEVTKTEPSDPKNRPSGFLRVVVRNDGRSPAKNVRMKVSPPFRSGTLEFEGKGAEEYRGELARRFSGDIAYSMLRPASEYRLMLDIIPAVFHNDNVPHTYEVSTHYETIDGQHTFDDSYTLDVDALAPLLLEPDTMARIALDLQSINATLQNRRPNP